MWISEAIYYNSHRRCARHTAAVFADNVIFRYAQESAQFAEGLETLGMATLIKTQHRVMKELFVYNPSIKVTADYLSHLLIPLWSVRGSNQREEEEAIILNWNDYLQDSEGMV